MRQRGVKASASSVLLWCTCWWIIPARDCGSVHITISYPYGVHSTSTYGNAVVNSQDRSPWFQKAYIQKTVSSHPKFHNALSDKKAEKSTSLLKSTETANKRSTSPELEAIREANFHFVQMRKTARCQRPRPKVIRVQDYYPDSNKDYLPRCAIIHRCDDDSGCCENERFRCAPKTQQEVTLYFYVIRNGSTSPSTKDLSNAVEALLFTNHTECECREKVMKEQLPSGSMKVQETKGLIIKCPECPEPFTLRTFNDGRCSCDCFDRDRKCIKVKRGRDSLRDRERRCVAGGQCHVPVCDYGAYDVISGRCPRRPEGMVVRRQPPSNREPFLDSHHRWVYFERD